MTPLSYSLKILMAAAAMIIRKIIKKKRPGDNPVMPISYLLILFFYFEF
jgi:hypothetical protein